MLQNTLAQLSDRSKKLRTTTWPPPRTPTLPLPRMPGAGEDTDRTQSVAPSLSRTNTAALQQGRCAVVEYVDHARSFKNSGPEKAAESHFLLRGGRLEFVGAREPMNHRPFVYVQADYMEMAEKQYVAKYTDQGFSAAEVAHRVRQKILKQVLERIGGPLQASTRSGEAHVNGLHVPHCVLSSTGGVLPGLSLYNELSTPELLLRPILGTSTVPDTAESFKARLHIEKAATLVNSITEACNSANPWFIVPESYAPRDEVNWFVSRAAVPAAIILGLGPPLDEFDDERLFGKEYGGPQASYSAAQKQTPRPTEQAKLELDNAGGAIGGAQPGEERDLEAGIGSDGRVTMRAIDELLERLLDEAVENAAPGDALRVELNWRQLWSDVEKMSAVCPLPSAEGGTEGAVNVVMDDASLAKIKERWREALMQRLPHNGCSHLIFFQTTRDKERFEQMFFEEVITGVLCINGSSQAWWCGQGENGVTLKSGVHLHNQTAHEYHGRFGGRSVTTKSILDGADPYRVSLPTDSAWLVASRALAEGSPTIFFTGFGGTADACSEMILAHDWQRDLELKRNMAFASSRDEFDNEKELANHGKERITQQHNEANAQNCLQCFGCFRRDDADGTAYNRMKGEGGGDGDDDDGDDDDDDNAADDKGKSDGDGEDGEKKESDDTDEMLRMLSNKTVTMIIRVRKLQSDRGNTVDLFEAGLVNKMQIELCVDMGKRQTYKMLAISEPEEGSEKLELRVTLLQKELKEYQARSCSFRLKLRRALPAGIRDGNEPHSQNTTPRGTNPSGLMAGRTLQPLLEEEEEDGEAPGPSASPPAAAGTDDVMPHQSQHQGQLTRIRKLHHANAPSPPTAPDGKARGGGDDDDDDDDDKSVSKMSSRSERTQMIELDDDDRIRLPALCFVPIDDTFDRKSDFAQRPLYHNRKMSAFGSRSKPENIGSVEMTVFADDDEDEKKRKKKVEFEKKRVLIEREASRSGRPRSKWTPQDIKDDYLLKKMMKGMWVDSFPHHMQTFLKNWPERFSEQSCIIVDTALWERAEDLQDRVSQLLSDARQDSKELGRERTEADRLAYAWRLVRVLEFNANRQGKTAARFQILMILITFFTVLVNIILQWAPEDYLILHLIPKNTTLVEIIPYFAHHLYVEEVLRAIAIILPLMLSLLLAAYNKFSPSERHGVLELSFRSLESEIYKYRLRVGVYSNRARERSGADGNEATAAQKPREIFAKVLDDVWTDVVQSDMRLGALVGPDDKLSDREWVLKRLSERENAASGAINLLGSPFDVRQVRTRKRGGNSNMGTSRGALEISSTSASVGKVGDDGFKPFTVEMYLKSRLMPLIAEHQSVAPQLEFANDVLTLVVLLASISTAGLASLKQELWVPVIIGLQHAAESIKNYRGYPSRLEANNTVLSELNKEIVKWYGLAISDQRVLWHRTNLVENCEASYLNEIMKRVASFKSTTTRANDSMAELDGLDEATDASGNQQAQFQYGPGKGGKGGAGEPKLGHQNSGGPNRQRLMARSKTQELSIKELSA